MLKKYKFVISVAILFLISSIFVLFFSINYLNDIEKKHFLYQLQQLKYAMIESLATSVTFTLEIENLPKTIYIGEKLYSVEYPKEMIIIKNVGDDNKYCNDTFSFTTFNQIIKNDLLTTILINTKCKNNDMYVTINTFSN